VKAIVNEIYHWSEEIGARADKNEAPKYKYHYKIIPRIINYTGVKFEESCDARSDGNLILELGYKRQFVIPFISVEQYSNLVYVVNERVGSLDKQIRDNKGELFELMLPISSEKAIKTNIIGYYRDSNSYKTGEDFPNEVKEALASDWGYSSGGIVPVNGTIMNFDGWGCYEKY